MKKYRLLEIIIFFSILLIFSLIPPFGSISVEGMRLIGLFVAFIYGMTITSDPWPALFTVIMFPFTGLIDMSAVLTIGFGSDVFIFVLFSLILVKYLETNGATTFVAIWLLKRKMLIGHPWRLIAMLLFVCWLISSFINAVVGLMITWSFIYQIFNYFGYKPYQKTSTLIMFGTCVMSALGLASLPWGNNSLVIFSAFTNVTGLEINYLGYMGYSIPFALMTIVFYILLCKFVFRADVTAMKNFDPTIFKAEDSNLTIEKIIALISTVILVVMILIPSILPNDSPIASLGKVTGLSGKILFIFAVLQIIRLKGERIFDFFTLSKQSTNWNLMLLVADILVFSALIGSSEAGISNFLTETLTPFFAGKSAIFLIVLSTIVTVIITNFMVNKIVAVLIISITMPIAQMLGIDLVQLGALYTVSCTIAFMLPSASQASTIFFANSAWARPKDIFAYGIVVIIVLTALAITWNLLYFSVFQ